MSTTFTLAKVLSAPETIMQILSLLLWLLVPQSTNVNHSLDTVDRRLIVHGDITRKEGVTGHSLVLDGRSLVELADSKALASSEFTVTLWFNPYELDAGQQMLAGKNQYSQNNRQWSLTIEPDGRLKAFLYQNGWSTITCDKPLIPGAWHRATLAVEASKATLHLNGHQAGEVDLQFPMITTEAPITLGGIWDRETVIQGFHGALDEFAYTAHALTPEQIASGYRPISSTHQVPKSVEPALLWNEQETILATDDLPVIDNIRFSVIKPYEFMSDGYRFLHGVALCFHNGKLYASFGHNRGGENTDTEEARFCISEDSGRTWSLPKTIDAGDGPIGISHGSFLSHQGTLWAFQGAYTGIMQDVHTRAYVLDETTEEWLPKGTVITDGFWPMQEPLPMEDGNWIMAGLKVGDGNPAAVAISQGDDFTKWAVVPIPAYKKIGMWGESTVIVNGKHITSISRYGDRAVALIASSDDFGRTWSKMRPSNLPMATSKPIAGTLGTGENYLICTTTKDSGTRRSPLTIAVSNPGETLFHKVFVIRNAVFPEGPGESHTNAALSYPYAVQYDDHLYVGYSNSGDPSTRIGTGRELWNNNSAELAVIPLSQLREPKTQSNE